MKVSGSGPKVDTAHGLTAPQRATSTQGDVGRRSPASSDPDQLSVFQCVVDESAGLADDREYQPPRKTQMTELPGTTWTDAFGDAA